MKSFLMTSLSVLTMFQLSAQKVKFGAKLGGTGAFLSERIAGQTGSTGTINNIDGRLYANIDYDHLTFQTGLGLFLKGGTGFNTSYSGTNDLSSSENELKLTYLQVPLDALYNIPIKAGEFFIGAGPYAALAVSGKSTVYTSNVSGNGTTSQSKTTTSVTFGGGINDINSVDYGLNILVGFRFNNGIDLGLEYDRGLRNISNDPFMVVKNVTVSFTFGYFFK